MDHLPEAARIRRGVVRLNRRLRQERGAGSLSPNQLSVLGHLYRHGPSTPGEVAAAERQRPQSLTRVFAELADEGLIAREPSTRDRRQTVLSLTEEGRRELVGDMADRDVWLAAALASLSPTERGVLELAGPLLERLADLREP
ncbi:MarR family transcriptional regulator [Streptomyces sp. NBC_00201]|uniref:MarR family winged helix-turn-helix transcriptional regulator n=1 Tax=unclassified Streptomyces TaxID=2593676 RepID=UPI002254A4E5|nr:MULTISPECIES: MarR family transcriptional regulator [unclassified Streptomyces]MCX5051274.1 MarR family transcriptional regulator [Streptomyces sp. NBC_00474]MCX5249160.1 MarR family transcriptional regulator [Streptomyces sp. NBC_00201]